MSEIYAKDIKLVDIDSIKLNPKNRNKHPEEQIERLMLIIKETGFRRPVTISNRTGLLVCGEGRYLAAKRLGLKQVPAMFQDYDSAKQEFADAVADNAIDKWSYLDTAGVIEDVKQFEDFDIDTLGVKSITDESLVNTVNKGDENSEWLGMPEFEGGSDYIKCSIIFATEEAREKFCRDHNLTPESKGGKTWTIYG